MSLDKLKFLLENNKSDGILFDTTEQAFRYAEDNNETIYLFIWENGKFLE